MSKMKELDLIAQGVADHCKEIMYDTVEWQIADQPVDGDDFNELRSYVMDKAIEKMAMELPEFRRLNLATLIGDYKQNNITNR